MTELKATTALRLILWENGYTPTPNVGKACYLKGWPTIAVDGETITRWPRRNRRFKDTGIRIENGLCAIDIDVDDPGAVAEIMKRIGELLPGSLLLVRRGKGAKIAIFVRTAEPFGRLHTRRWSKPGETEEDGAHSVEIFGGGSARQFGAFGAHTLAADGTVLIVYRWPRRSPLDTRLDQLAIFPKARFAEAIDAAEAILEQRGWRAVLRSKSGENTALHVRDLTEGMVFVCDDGVTRTLAELQELARRDAVAGMRCSASWLEGPSAHRTDRCLITRSKSGVLMVFETASHVTHMRKLAAPDMNEIAAKFARMKELYRV